MLIGVCGALGSGKDTVGEYLVANYDFTRIAFADKLKKSASALWPGLRPNDWNEWKNRPQIQIQVIDEDGEDLFSVTAREFLQNYGTEAHREIFGYDFWVDQGLKPYIDGEFSNVVVTDVRFENEAEAIYEAGGFVIRVVREGTGGDSHASEKGIPDSLCDVEITNDGTFDDLYKDLDEIMEEFYAVVQVEEQKPAVQTR